MTDPGTPSPSTAPTTTAAPTDTPTATPSPTDTAPPTSQPPTSQPPTTRPPTSAPPTSQPPTSQPPTSQPPASSSPSASPTSRPSDRPSPGPYGHSPTIYTPTPHIPGSRSGGGASGGDSGPDGRTRVHWGGDEQGSLPRAASGFGHEAVDLPVDVNNLLIAIADLGDFVGGDDIGKKFRSGYDRAVANAVGYVGALSTVYAQVSTNLTNMAANMRDAEWAGTIALPKVGDGPEFSASDGTLTP
ncbi:hypothetical protein [Actinoallomurus rhizosphaericola]|uniref:hypothetical protein n=1 Tax=Actinoallomurus rhizosphaericola TaxID=2952536 RepID=UPI0020922D9D|nr:hypothetical protein [Actinoallomurus rhizosphaericola]MCO5996132.1 hypothetical protein [Actinoallomurus rhizosphaericola]